MAEGTRIKTLEEIQKRSEIQISELKLSVNTLSEQLQASSTATNLQFEALQAAIAKLSHQHIPPHLPAEGGLRDNGRTFQSPHGGGNSIPGRQFKLELPKFDGSDPQSWIFRADQFFAFYEIPNFQRIQLAAV